MNLRDEYGYQLPNHRLREKLGLNQGKLPDNKRQWNFVLDGVKVTLLTREQARERAPTSTRPHRVYATCPRCGAEVPAGRMHQHQRGKNCKSVL